MKTAIVVIRARLAAWVVIVHSAEPPFATLLRVAVAFARVRVARSHTELCNV